MYTKIEAVVVDQTLQITSLPPLASGGEDEVTLHVTFDDSWVSAGKLAVFYRDETKVYQVVMENDSCLVPREVYTESGIVCIGVVGIVGAVVRTTEVVPVKWEQGAASSVTGHEPLPDIYKQILTAYGTVSSDVALANARINNLITNGGASDDAELVDIRVGTNGATYGTAGAAVREQVAGLAEAVTAACASGVPNLFDPFAAQGSTALSDTNGASFTNAAYWVTGRIDVSGIDGIVFDARPYKLLWYDASNAVVGAADRLKRGTAYDKPAGAVYVVIQFAESVSPFDERFDIVVCDTATNLTDVKSIARRDEVLPLFAVDERNLFDPYKCLPAMCFETATGDRYNHNDFWMTDFLSVNGLAGLQANVGMYKVGWFDADRNILGTGSATAPAGAAYVVVQFEETQVPYASRFGIILCDSAVDRTSVRPHYYTGAQATADSIGSYGDYVFDIPLTGTTYMSDHTMVNGQLYVINASSDDHAEYAGVTVYDVDPAVKTSAYVKTIQHNLGHANSIDYCEANGCLILGNGSSDATLPGEIYILPDAANKETWEYADCIKIDVSGENWGIKTNVVWGEANDGEHNIAYVITNNNANVRKLLLTKTNGAFDGGYVVLGEWSTDAVDVNQGTVYRNGKLHIAIGHSQLWGLEYTLNSDGSIGKQEVKDVLYDATGAVLTAPFSEGITIEDGYTYVGASDGRVLVYANTTAPGKNKGEEFTGVVQPENISKTYNVALAEQFRTEKQVTKSAKNGQYVWETDANAFSIRIPAIAGDVITFPVFDNTGHGYVFGCHKEDGTPMLSMTKAMIESSTRTWMTYADGVATVDVSGMIASLGVSGMIFCVQYKNEDGFYIHSKRLPPLRFDWLGLSEADEKRLQAVEAAAGLDIGINFNPNLPSGYYEPTEMTYTLGRTSTAVELYAVLDPLVDGVYCTRELLFTESGGLPGYVYRFKPQVPGNKTSGDNVDFPTILIVADHHGQEKGSAISLVYFLKDMVENWATNPMLEYLRFNVNFVVVPTANPYGFQYQKHKNRNLIDLNRNYDANWVETDSSLQTYGGASAASEIETQAIQTLIKNTSDAILYIDYHTYGALNVNDYWNINWHMLCEAPYATAAPAELAVHQIQRATAHYKRTYFPNGIGAADFTGHVTRQQYGGNSKIYARQQGIPNALVFEGCGGLPDESEAYTQRAIRLNVEQIGNYIFNAVSWFVRNPNRIREEV